MTVLTSNAASPKCASELQFVSVCSFVGLIVDVSVVSAPKIRSQASHGYQYKMTANWQRSLAECIFFVHIGTLQWVDKQNDFYCTVSLHFY